MTATETPGSTEGTGNRPFKNRELARAAAQKSAEVRKAKKAARGSVASSTPASATEELPDGSVGVVVPVSYVEVIRVLQRQALGGDVSAARELRNWKEQHPEVNEHVSLEEQPAVLRDRLLRRLIREEQELLDAETGGDQEGATETVSDTADHPAETTDLGGEATPARAEGVPVSEAEAPQRNTYSGNDLADHEHTNGGSIEDEQTTPDGS